MRLLYEYGLPGSGRATRVEPAATASNTALGWQRRRLTPERAYHSWPSRAMIRSMRVEAGAVVDEFDLPGIGHVVARHTRTKTPDGGVTWACMFTIAAAGANDLAVVHRLSAPSLYEGRRSVRHAVEFLAGRAFGAGVAAEPAERPDDDHLAWRRPARPPIPADGKRSPDRRVALSPSRGHGRRAADRRADADRGVVPNLASFTERAGDDPSRADAGRSDVDAPAPRDPEPSPLR